MPFSAPSIFETRKLENYSTLDRRIACNTVRVKALFDLMIEQFSISLSIRITQELFYSDYSDAELTRFGSQPSSGY